MRNRSHLRVEDVREQRSKLVGEGRVQPATVMYHLANIRKLVVNIYFLVRSSYMLQLHEVEFFQWKTS